MGRIRFLTAIAVGSLVNQTLADEPSADNTSAPRICFEWIVLEALVRRERLAGSVRGAGIPGSSKAQAVISHNKRLNASNYLKTPNVFGFHGVFAPLARGLKIVDFDSLPAEQALGLVRAWEATSGFNGFADEQSGTPGGRLIGRLREAVLAALRAGKCVTPTGSELWTQLAGALHPDKAGDAEKAHIRRLLLDERWPVRAELARAVSAMPWPDAEDSGGLRQLVEPVFLRSVRQNASAELAGRIDAVFAYEHFSGRLDSAFRTLCHISTAQGTQPLTAKQMSENPVMQQAAKELPDSFRRLTESLAAFNMATSVESTLGHFGSPTSASDFGELLLQHHEDIQRRKSAQGKRAWLDRYAGGWVVRPLYRHGSAHPIDDKMFLHPFRAAALWSFMDDTKP